MILHNGEPTETLDALDRGLHYGEGLFETLAVHRGTPLLWDRHVARLRDGCQRLGLPSPNVDQLQDEVGRVAGDAVKCAVKVMITGGVGGRGYRQPASASPSRLVFGYPWPDYPDHWRQTGVVVRLCRTSLSRNPLLAGMKHLNRIEQVLARSEWRDDDIAEGLMQDTEGHLIEGTMSNLFLVHNGSILTPTLEQCGVAGVMRAQVLATADRLGMPVEVKEITVAEALSADALFVTNSLLGLWPVRQFEERIYAVNPLVHRLQQQLQRDRACV